MSWFRGTLDACVNGDVVWWVCLADTLFSSWKSTVRRSPLSGWPGTFSTMCILAHQSMWSFGSNFSSTPSSTSLSRSALTIFSQ